MSGAFWCSQGPFLYMLTSLFVPLLPTKASEKLKSQKALGLWLENEGLWSCCCTVGVSGSPLELTAVQEDQTLALGSCLPVLEPGGAKFPHLEQTWAKRTLLLAPCFSPPSCTRWCLVSMALFSKRISLLCLLVEWTLTCQPLGTGSELAESL